MFKGKRRRQKHPFLAARIREARQRLKLKRPEFALCVGVTVKTLEMWERNHTEPAPMDLCRLVLATDATFEYFLGDEDEMREFLDGGERDSPTPTERREKLPNGSERQWQPKIV